MRLEHLNEDSSSNSGIYDPASDNRRLDIKDTRKHRVTLSHLNKLRKYRDFKRDEMKDRLEVVKLVYSQPPAEDSGDMM